ncbi:CHAT domain-containing protein [Amycolatopsis rhizosphaerae]|uniref:CHAT domain-containing protein n=1 Tax=Amycolatopsis rhizosphaerae TaxID=2053003 RepID=A0A558B5C1_9PSEU|nr:CHAT domain-containing protein [Amycolatopsis rhizosphaerae]TVT31672.1 CHAT domain-containing protein [Amycolatopsis rhizosphaerae]
MSQDRIAVLGAELERAVERDDAEAIIEAGERLLGILPSGDPRRAIPLYYAGLARAVRFDGPGGGAGMDRRRATAYLREARRLLPRDHPWWPHATLLTGLLLSHRLLQRSDGGTRHLPEAIAALEAALDTVVGEDQPDVRLLVRYRLAMLLAKRYLLYGGAEEDRVRSLAELTALAEDPAVDRETADVCRIFASQLGFLAGLPPELRSGEVTAEQVEHLQWRLPAGRPEAMAEAVRQLESVAGDTIGKTGVPSPLPMLKALTRMQKSLVDKQNLSPGELDDAITLIGEAVAQEEPGTPDAAVIAALGAALRRERARRGGEDSDAQTAEELATLLETLGEHPLRPAIEAVHTAITAEGRLPHQPEDLAALTGRLERFLTNMPEDHPARVRMLMRFASALVFQAGITRSAGQLDRVRTLVQDAHDRGTLDEGSLPITSFILSWVDGMQGTLETDADRLNSALDRMREAANLLPDGHELRSLLGVAVGSLLSQRYLATGNLEDIDAMSYYADRLPADLPADRRWIPRQLSAMTKFARNQNKLTPQLIDELITEFEEADRLVPDDQRRWTGGGRLVASLRMLRAAVTGEGARFPTSGRELAEFRAAAEMIAHQEPALLDQGGDEGIALVGAAFAARDRRQLDRGITLLARRAAGPSLAAFERLRVLVALGNAFRMRHLLTGSPRDLDNAVSRLEEARLLALREPAVPDAAVIFNALGDAYFARADPHRRDARRAVTAGLDGLRLRTQEVLLQSGAGRGLAAARSAEGESAQVTRWCLAAGEPEAAVRALELGRAMVLHSATVDAGIPALLRENGHHDLAGEWEDETQESPWDVAGGEALPLDPGLTVPSDLRRRVMLALEHTEAERGILLPPDPAAIATALKRAGAGALVYLLPRDEHGDGLAVLVRADGEIRHLPLPGLGAGPGGPLENFERAQRKVQYDEGAWPDWEAAAGELGAWAWETAMGPVLAETGTPRPGHPPRLVLVPVGRLGVVPWHAAYRPVPGGVRYACQDAILCYASSARQFTDSVGRETRPWPENPALIEVAGSDLVWAAEEMEEIRRHCYPGCVHLGSDPTEVITPERVLALLPGAGGPGASVLHFGCHARRTDPPIDSYLSLDGEAELPVRDILRQARARPAGAAGGLVVLATCVSDLTQDAHDEALTLATAFLAAGAAGVLGARWPVRDVPTGLFMIMFHHYLNSGYPDPATALRATQLWMLNPRRRLPPGVGGLLADELDTHPLGAPVNWAAFTYQGQ